MMDLESWGARELWRIDERSLDGSEEWDIRLHEVHGQFRPALGRYWLTISCVTRDVLGKQVSYDHWSVFSWSIRTAERRFAEAMTRYQSGACLPARRTVPWLTRIILVALAIIVGWQTWDAIMYGFDPIVALVWPFQLLAWIVNGRLWLSMRRFNATLGSRATGRPRDA